MQGPNAAEVNQEMSKHKDFSFFARIWHVVTNMPAPKVEPQETASPVNCMQEWLVYRGNSTETKWTPVRDRDTLLYCHTPHLNVHVISKMAALETRMVGSIYFYKLLFGGFFTHILNCTAYD